MKPDQSTNEIKKSEKDANRDPLSGTAGSHPVGTGLGAVAGGAIGGVAVGAAVGTIAGPVGTVVGAAAGAIGGAVAGGIAGKELAEDINPTTEHGFWRSTYASRPYVSKDRAYEEYAPAFQFGWESRSRYVGRTFEDSEPHLAREWPRHQGISKLPWSDAKHAARDAWERVGNRQPAAPKK